MIIFLIYDTFSLNAWGMPMWKFSNLIHLFEGRLVHQAQIDKRSLVNFQSSNIMPVA